MSSKLTIERWEEGGLHMLLDDGVGCLQSKSLRQIQRAKSAIEFQALLMPLLKALNEADNELLAAVLAADGTRTLAASEKRTEATNQLVLAYGRLGLLAQAKVHGAVMLDTAEPHPEVAAEKRRPVGNKCPDCGADLVEGFGLMGGGYGPYWGCDGAGCPYLYKEQIPNG